ncbi:MAG TPA: hypothetical protein VFL79_17915 [Terriglobia bacterium]|nr:hypothetical protein [Terriglobia bacterium]
MAKKGTPNRATVEIGAKLAALGCDPIEILARIAMDKKAPLENRIRCAIELASYTYPKRKPLESPNPQPSSGEMKVVVETAPVAKGSDNDN